MFIEPWSLTLEDFLQLAGDLVGRGVHGALHQLVGTRQRLIDHLLDRRLADRDQPRLTGRQLLRHLMQLLARQRPPNHCGTTRTPGRSIRLAMCGLPFSLPITAASYLPIIWSLCRCSTASRSVIAAETLS